MGMFGACETSSKLDAREGVGNGGRYWIPGAVYYKYHPALHCAMLNSATVLYSAVRSLPDQLGMIISRHELAYIRSATSKFNTAQHI